MSFQQTTRTEYYSNLFEAAYDAIFVETLDGRIVDVNSAACELLKYSREELLSMNVADLLPPEVFESVSEILQQELVTGGKSFVGHNIRKDGKRILVEVRVRSFWQDTEQYLVVIARDITERIELLEKASRQNHYLSSLHEISLGLLNRLELNDLLKSLVINAGKLFGTPDGYVCVVDETRGVLERKIGIGRYVSSIGHTYTINEGLTGKVLQSGQPLAIENYQNWPNRRLDSALNTLQTTAGIPLKSGEKTIGVIGLSFYDLPRSFSVEEIELFSRFEDLASIALVNASLHSSLTKSEKELQQNNADLTAAHEELIASEEELRQQFNELMINEDEIRHQNIVLTALHETALGLMHRLDLNDVLKMIAKSATELLGTKHGWIYLLDEEKSVFVEKIGLGIFATDVKRQTKVTEGLAGQGYKTGEIITIDDYSSWENRIKDPLFDNMHSVIQVPLKSDGKVIGLFGLTFLDTERKFSDHEIALLSRFAELASIALDNASLVTAYKSEITERRQTEQALRASEENNQTLINAIPDPMLIINRLGVLVDFRGSKEQLHFLSGEFLEKTASEVFPIEVADKLMQYIELTIETGTIQVFEYQIPFQGKTEYYEARVVASGDEEVLVIIRDVSDRKSMEIQLKHLSLHDALTGLYNRAFFEEEMKRFEEVRNVSAGLLVSDVDGLKIINDSLGHDMGDIALKAVADILKNSFRPCDLVARIGGDEIAVLVPHNSAQVFEANCRKIRKQVDKYNAEHPTVPISLSIGFAVSGEPPVNMTALFKEADNNMYREKLHQQKSARSAIVQALMKALEARDFITEGHGDRLQNMMESFATRLGLPGQNIADLRLLARFHDIGKVGIPDSILFKTSRLTEEEYAVMRQHCEIGYRIAKSAPDLEPIADWILKHQEWWNGKGYPLGIAGKDIPLACRMLGIVDAFDAMTSDRPYRKAMSQSAAIAELHNCAGSQFDPILVGSFAALVCL